MTELILRRGAGWGDKWRSYAIIVDGREIGSIKEHTEVRVPVSAGTHELKLAIDWCRSPDFPVTVAEGKTVIIDCGPNANPFTSLLYITLFKNKYIWLKEADASSHP